MVEGIEQADKDYMFKFFQELGCNINDSISIVLITSRSEYFVTCSECSCVHGDCIQLLTYMSSVTRKPCFAYWKTKIQISCAVSLHG